MKPIYIPNDPENYGGAWSAARNRIKDKDAEAELDALIKAGMLTDAQKQAVMAKQKAGLSDRPMDALSEDPAFLDKVFPKKKK